jgi:hypothetical protein
MHPRPPAAPALRRGRSPGAAPSISAGLELWPVFVYGWDAYWRGGAPRGTRTAIANGTDYDGILQLAEYALSVGGKPKDMPLSIGTRQEVLAKYRLIKRG